MWREQCKKINHRQIISDRLQTITSKYFMQEDDKYVFQFKMVKQFWKLS